MTHHRKSWILAGLALLAGGAACGGGSDGGPPASGLKTVRVTNDEFQPVTTTISAGDTIVWAWAAGSVTHNVISTGTANFLSKGTTTLPGSLGTDFFNNPATHQVIFATAGTYEYYCSHHGTSTGAPGGNAGMHGVIQVDP